MIATLPLMKVVWLVFSVMLFLMSSAAAFECSCEPIDHPCEIQAGMSAEHSDQHSDQHETHSESNHRHCLSGCHHVGFVIVRDEMPVFFELPMGADHNYSLEYSQTYLEGPFRPPVKTITII